MSTLPADQIAAAARIGQSSKTSFGDGGEDGTAEDWVVSAKDLGKRFDIFPTIDIAYMSSSQSFPPHRTLGAA